jgi:hypothetical protein
VSLLLLLVLVLVVVRVALVVLVLVLVLVLVRVALVVLVVLVPVLSLLSSLLLLPPPPLEPAKITLASILLPGLSYVNPSRSPIKLLRSVLSPWYICQPYLKYQLAPSHVDSM